MSVGSLEKNFLGAGDEAIHILECVSYSFTNSVESVGQASNLRKEWLDHLQISSNHVRSCICYKHLGQVCFKAGKNGMQGVIGETGYIRAVGLAQECKNGLWSLSWSNHRRMTFPTALPVLSVVSSMLIQREMTLQSRPDLIHHLSVALPHVPLSKSGLIRSGDAEVCCQE